METERFLVYSPMLLSNICMPSKLREKKLREKKLTIQDADALD